ncbi:hypothetical protein MM239_17270 [Belliella sp. DSM 111904]|uniref:Phage protein n=1 Tax=Belliella filtrata TaxID=2923435 RepID=A0ABS9V418_9BACT|nr:hypothetical protein [Belliella filtrata]MCH7411152.1 hypothetical protein [Belliella filtrata]
MNNKIKLLDRHFEFKKSSYSYKNFEDRNKRSYNPTLASDILEYLYSCIAAGYFYIRQDCPIDIVDFYGLIDTMEAQDPELLFKDNKQLFKDFLGLGEIAEDSTDEPKKKQ